METKILDNRLLIFNSNVIDGNMSHKYAENDEIVENNRKKLFKKLKINENYIYNMHVTYSDKIAIIHSRPTNKEIVADAIISELENFYITLCFADCIPLIVYDKYNNLFSFAHLGWQSICADLHKKIIVKMIQEIHSNPSDLLIYIGPSIKSASYAFTNPVQLSMPSWKPYLLFNKGIYYIDLTKYVVDNILNLGINQNNIIISPVDTGNNNEYFSHYRSMHDKSYQEGRFILGTGKNIRLEKEKF